MKPPLHGAAIVITGASSGIGQAIARQLAPIARALVLIARRRDRLEMLRQELLAARPDLLISVQPCDITDDAAVDEALERIQQEVGTVDVLINNAGFGDNTLFQRASWDKLEQMIRLNVLALTRLTFRLVGPMIQQGRGGILNISSVLGLAFIPGVAAYSGTKHYVTCFSEVLRQDLSGTGVAVSQVCPGPVTTEFMEVAGNDAGYAVPSLIQVDPEYCARIALRGFRRGKALIIPGLVMRLVIGLSRITPRPILRLIYGWMSRRMQKQKQLQP